MPVPLRFHEMVSIGDDLIVVGGISLSGRRSSNLYRLSCRNSDCHWSELPQKLAIAREVLVAIAIPDNFVECS